MKQSSVRDTLDARMQSAKIVVEITVIFGFGLFSLDVIQTFSANFRKAKAGLLPEPFKRVEVEFEPVTEAT